jgi:hypothetical protein
MARPAIHTTHKHTPSHQPSPSPSPFILHVLSQRKGKERKERRGEEKEEEEKEGEEKGVLLLEHHQRSTLAATSISPELEEKPFPKPLLQAQAMEEPHLDLLPCCIPGRAATAGAPQDHGEHVPQNPFPSSPSPHGFLLTLKNVPRSFKYHEQVTNILGMVEVKRRNKITNKTHRGDGELP